MKLTPSKAIPSLLVVFLLAIFLLQLGLSIRHQSQTFDEGFHLAAGYRYWQCRDFGINSEHPPLVKWIAAAPLWFGHVGPPKAGVCGQEPTTKDHGYELGFRYLYRQGLDGDALLYRARMAVALFALLLAIATFLFARALFGWAAGIVALLLLVFEPTILAHGALVTTDTAVSAFLLASVYALYRYYRQPSFGRLVQTGVLTGLTFASKHSGVLIVPILIGLSLVEVVRQRQEAWNPATGESLVGSLPRQLFRWASILVAIFAVGVATLWCVYGLRYAARPGGAAMTTPLSQFIVEAQAQGTRGAMLTVVIPALAKWHLLPQAYLYGLVDVLNVSDPGQPPFLLGKLYPHGRWFYFPIVFFIKSTLGFLVLLVLAVFLGPWRGPDRLWKLFYLVLPPAVILLVAMQSGLNIGYRHVLAIVPFLCILIAAGVVEIWHRGTPWKIVIATLLLAHVASSLRAYPNYLPYSNEAWGGPMKTYRYLTDSNVDWGQGLYQARDYLKQHSPKDCWIAYDGAADPAYYGIPCKPLPGNAGDAGELPPAQISGTVLLSDLTLSGIEWEPGDLNPYRDFFAATPVANIGGAMLVYQGRFDAKGIVAVAQIAQAMAMLGDHKPSEAFAQAQAATTLTPRSVRAHLLLGRALAALGRKDEARQQLQTALSLADQAGREWYPLQIAAAREELAKLDQAPANKPGQ